MLNISFDISCRSFCKGIVRSINAQVFVLVWVLWLTSSLILSLLRSAASEIMPRASEMSKVNYSNYTYM